MSITINAGRYSPNHSFEITGVSYIGNPQPNTAMFISRKVQQLVRNLSSVTNCLVFAENGIEMLPGMEKKHCFVFSDNPQMKYAEFTEEFHREEEFEEQKTGYHNVGGALISETAVIGSNTIIEPNCIIGPGVVIGCDCRIRAGVVVKHAVLLDGCIINEYAVIGSSGFTMAENSAGEKIRIYSLGKVIIGNNVEIGVHDNISRGSGGNTIIEDNVKIDALVHVGHDVYLSKSTEITAGAVIGGFVNAGVHSYIGINAVIRNRINLGKNSFIGMGAVVTKSVDEGITVVGNPARHFEKK